MTLCRIGSDGCLTINTWDSNAFRTVDEIVTEASAVTEKIAVNVAIIAVDNSPELAVAFARRDVAAQAAMYANRGRSL